MTIPVQSSAPVPKQPASSSDDSTGCGGCLLIPLIFLMLWALIFGVTVGGKHYGVSGCSFDKGVEFDR